MVKRLHFHIEGGCNKTHDTDMRRAFNKFFSELVRPGKSVVHCTLHGPRTQAYKRFCHALKTKPDSAESHSKTYYSPMIGWAIPAVGIALARVIVGRANRRQHLPFFPSGSAAMTSDFDDVVSAARRVGVPVSVVVAVGLIGATGIAWGLYKASQTVMLP